MLLGGEGYKNAKDKSHYQTRTPLFKEAPYQLTTPTFLDISLSHSPLRIASFSSLVHSFAAMADTALTEAAKNGEVPKILNLLRQGGDVNERDSGGQTALMFAARNGHLEAVRLLLEKGAGVDLKRASDGRTALHFAAWHGHVEVAKKLIKAGASVDLKKNDGWTALHLAANHGHAEVAKDLLRAGASTVIRNKHNRTALDVANQKNNEEVASILRASQRWRKGAQVPSVEVREEVAD